MSCEIGYVKVDLLKALGMSDSQAIKTAIDCAAATKSFIEFGEGTYTLTEQNSYGRTPRWYPRY